MYKLIRKTDLIKVYFRLFLLEASWNYEKMQNIGVAYALMPVGNRLYSDFDGRKAFVGRNLKFFNTHPAMASFIMGVVIHMEEKMKLGEPVTPEEIEALKNSMMGPLAAMGDNFFWEYLRPFCAVMGVCIILLCGDKYMLAFLGPLVALFLYNAFGLSVRYAGLIKGYENGPSIINYIAKLDLRSMNERLSLTALIMLGALFPFLFSLNNAALLPFQIQAMHHSLQGLFMFLSLLLLLLLLKIKITPTVLFYGIIIGIIMLTYIY